MKEAALYDRLSDGQVQCRLCGRRCMIADQEKGFCCVRENRGGSLFTLVYGRVISQNIDPIEKKPLYHVYPGSFSFSIATPGCNFRCIWCQNWEISQMPREQHLIAGQEATPEGIVKRAHRQGCRSISYTYTEPTLFFEYAHEIAQEAHKAGLINVFVTNGYMTGEMLDAFHPCLDAANVDLKAFRDETYRQYIGAPIQPVLDSLKKMAAMGTWVEVTTLIVPTINDDPQELRDAAQFLVRELGADTPWHLSRFHPAYKAGHLPPTPLGALERAREIGFEEGLKYVYLGNVRTPGAEDTHCTKCRSLLIERDSLCVVSNRVRDGRCPDCGERVAGLGMSGAVY